jgi:ABC-type nitrate/sulfonate/bicarbonate transport system permease component
MAATGQLSRPRLSARGNGAVVLTRILGIAAASGIWEALAISGLFYRDVVPPLGAIAAALTRLILDPRFYSHLAATAAETGLALAVGSLAGLAVGLALGIDRFLGKAYEPLLYYFGPTPKIIFFPIMIMWFGVGPGSKIAMGAISCFFPVALSTAAGIRLVSPVLVRVGRSFRASPWQMIRKIYLPAIRVPVLNGLRLGVGVAIIGVLLAETKLSNRGAGFLIIQFYQRFDMPDMYALMIIVFALAILINTMIGALISPRTTGRSRGGQ